MAADVFGQTTVPPEDIDDSWDDTYIILDPYNLRTAEDYQDFIDRLQTLAIDYQGYFAGLSHYQAKKMRHGLQKLVFRINKGDYCSDFELLSDDLEDLIAELEFDWNNVEQTDTTRKLMKLSHLLERDLELMVEELNEDIVERLECQEVNRALLGKYLVQKRRGIDDAEKVILEVYNQHQKLVLEVKKALEQLNIENIKLTEEQLENLEQLEELDIELKELDLEDIGGSIIILPAVPNVPDIPAPVVPDVTIGPKKRIYIHPSGKPGISRQFIDSIAVTDPSLPIYVKNETGNVRVEGWNKSWLLVQFDVEVLAESERGAKDFTDDIELKLISNANGVYVKSHFPSLSDPKRENTAGGQVLSSVPRHATPLSWRTHSAR